MRVVNERKWRRTKWLFTASAYLLFLWAIGGLEDGPVRSWHIALLSLLIAVPMTIHMTADWNDQSELEEWLYRQRRE